MTSRDHLVLAQEHQQKVEQRRESEGTRARKAHAEMRAQVDAGMERDPALRRDTAASLSQLEVERMRAEFARGACQARVEFEGPHAGLGRVARAASGGRALCLMYRRDLTRNPPMEAFGDLSAESVVRTSLGYETTRLRFHSRMQYESFVSRARSSAFSTAASLAAHGLLGGLAGGLSKSSSSASASRSSQSSQTRQVSP
jgi:hypothetical protein